MNILLTKPTDTLLKSLLLSFILIISACSDKNVKPADSDILSVETLDKSISSSDREKYSDGITALSKNDYGKAQRIFNELVRNKPGLAGPYTNLALIHFKKKEYEEALKLSERAIQLNPNQAEAYNLRAQIYVNNGKIHDAKADYIKAVELKPDYINAQYNLALLYDIYLQEIKLAIKHYELYMALLKSPDQPTQEWINHLKGTLR